MNASSETSHQRMISIVALVLFLSVALFQAARQPIIDNYDMINVSLLILNRENAAQYPNDLAMQAATWWPYYTPLYLTLISSLRAVLYNFESVYLLLTAVAYAGLLTGFYALGKALNLPFYLAVGLAALSSVFFWSSLGLSWTGAGVDMAAARNLYLAVTPHLLRWLLLIDRHKRTNIRTWVIFGAMLGALANLHSVTGLFLITVLAGLMLIGVITGQLRPLSLAALGVAVMPGLFFIFRDTLFPLEDIFTLAPTFDVNWNEQMNIAAGYANTVRADFLILRLPNWEVPILIYTLLTMITGGYLLWRRNIPTKTAWAAFGSVQFVGVLLLLPLDWFTVLTCGLWLIYAQQNRNAQLALIFLALVGLLALPVGLLFTQLANNGLLPIGYGISRTMMRGGQYAYPALIIIFMLALQQMFNTIPAPQKSYVLLCATLTLLTGFMTSVDPAARYPQIWLPLNAVTICSVILLIGWQRFAHLPALRFIIFALLVAQISSHVLQTLDALPQNWSFTDTQSVYYNAFNTGRWIQANTPPSSLIASDETFMRFFARRPLVGGAEDAAFLRYDTNLWMRLIRLNDEFNAALNLPETLRTFCERYGVDYVIVRQDRTIQGFILVYENNHYRIYAVDDAG